MIISALPAADDQVELVERKGLGHPDTICDALTETLSRNLCREYLNRYGEILHHNVDKALLHGGRAAPAFGGGAVLTPISIYLAGRAITDVGHDIVPVEEIAIEGSRTWARTNLHALDAQHHLRVHSLIRPGSQDLRALFARQPSSQVVLANDTAIGVGYAPMSPLELLVLAIEGRINGRDRTRSHPGWGEDIKIMGVRTGSAVRLTVACAMIDRHLSHIADYLAETAAVKELVHALATEHGFPQCTVAVNAADNPASGAFYLTVTGTSAEAGDDGEAGRGNRVNGLIAPYRPMILEAVAGKNPVTHVGKIYNVLARDMAAQLVTSEPEITAAQCLLLGEIGTPVTEPAMIHIRLTTRDGVPLTQIERRVQEIARSCLSRVPDLVDAFVAGTIDIF